MARTCPGSSRPSRMAKRLAPSTLATRVRSFASASAVVRRPVGETGACASSRKLALSAKARSNSARRASAAFPGGTAEPSSTPPSARNIRRSPAIMLPPTPRPAWDWSTVEQWVASCGSRCFQVILHRERRRVDLGLASPGAPPRIGPLASPRCSTAEPAAAVEWERGQCMLGLLDRHSWRCDMAGRLDGRSVVVLLAEGFEDLEFWVTVMRLQEEGAQVTVAGLTTQPVQGKNGLEATADVEVEAVSADALDAVVVPGGWAPDKLRRYDAVKDLVAKAYHQGKVVGLICHAGLVGISAGIVDGKRATGSLGIKDDLVNAGATWVDEPAFRDGNLVWGRVVPDIPDFCRELVAAIEGGQSG